MNVEWVEFLNKVNFLAIDILLQNTIFVLITIEANWVATKCCTGNILKLSQWPKKSFDFKITAMIPPPKKKKNPTQNDWSEVKDAMNDEE